MTTLQLHGLKVEWGQIILSMDVILQSNIISTTVPRVLIMAVEVENIPLTCMLGIQKSYKVYSWNIEEKILWSKTQNVICVKNNLWRLWYVVDISMAKYKGDVTPVP